MKVSGLSFSTMRENGKKTPSDMRIIMDRQRCVDLIPDEHEEEKHKWIDKP